MYRCKTGALIGVACKMGCLLAGASHEQIEKAGIYSDALGLAFQIIDDILDEIGSEKELGKPIGSDREQGKTTFVSLFGMEKAKERAEALTNEALNALGTFPHNEFLIELTKSLVIRKS